MTQGNSVVAYGLGKGEKWVGKIAKEDEETFMIMDMLTILIVIMIYICKFLQTVQVKYVSFFVCQLYNKNKLLSF